MKRFVLLLAACGGAPAPATAPPAAHTAPPAVADGCRDTTIKFDQISPGGIRTLSLWCEAGVISGVVKGTEHGEPLEPVTRTLDRAAWDELWVVATSAGDSTCIADPDEDYERVIKLARDGQTRKVSCQGVWTPNWEVFSESLEEILVGDD